MYLTGSVSAYMISGRLLFDIVWIEGAFLWSHYVQRIEGGMMMSDDHFRIMDIAIFCQKLQGRPLVRLDHFPLYITSGYRWESIVALVHMLLGQTYKKHALVDSVRITICHLDRECDLWKEMVPGLPVEHFFKKGTHQWVYNITPYKKRSLPKKIADFTIYFDDRERRKKVVACIERLCTANGRLTSGDITDALKQTFNIQDYDASGKRISCVVQKLCRMGLLESETEGCKTFYKPL